MNIEPGKIDVTVDGKTVRSVPAEFVPVPFGRGAPIGRTPDGTLFAAFSTEGLALESVLLSSADDGRSWSERRLDWRQFSSPKLGFDVLFASSSPEPPDEAKMALYSFFEYRWAMSSDSFGVLKNGALVWAFLQNLGTYGVGGGGTDAYIIKSEDGGESWDGPFKVDKSPHAAIGVSSNRMTELPDGTLLWCQRLGPTEAERARFLKAAEKSERPWEVSPDSITHVLRSTDGGLTWGDRTPLPDWCGETTILRLQSGRLIAALRYQPPLPFPDNVTHASLMERSLTGHNTKLVYLADSDDDGRTWVNFRPVRRTPGGESDLVYGEAHSQLSQLSDGTLVLTHDRRYPYGSGRVLARVSRDEGDTWSPDVYSLTLDRGREPESDDRGYGTGYASSVVLEDDTIVTMTGAGTCVRWRIE